MASEPQERYVVDVERLLGAKDYVAAEKVLNEALSLNPTDYRLNCLRFDLLERQGRPTEAVLAIEEALRKSPNDWRLILERGSLLARSGLDIENAVFDLETVLQIDPSNLRAKLTLALVFLESYPEKSLELAESVMRASPGNCSGFRVAALAMEKLDRVDDGIRALQLELQIELSEGALILISKYYLSKHRFLDAIRSGELALQIEPDNKTVLRYLVEAYKGAGKLAEAEIVDHRIRDATEPPFE